MIKRRNEGSDQKSKWLTTFNDLVTLLLTFFVLTLSLSKLDVAKVKKMSRSLNDALGRLDAGSMVDIRIFNPFVIPMRRYGLAFERRKGALARRIQEKGRFEAEVVDEGVRITMNEKVLFKTGEANIQNTFAADLRKLCAKLRQTGNEIRVEGHTDDVPINTDRFASNWELSTARAARVVRFMIAEGDMAPERFSAAGYGDSRPRRDGADEKSRAENRRVEIFVTVQE